MHACKAEILEPCIYELHHGTGYAQGDLQPQRPDGPEGRGAGTYRVGSETDKTTAAKSYKV